MIADSNDGTNFLHKLFLTNTRMYFEAEISLIPLGVTAAASATDAPIEKKIIGSDMTGLEISNEEMADIIKLV